MNITETWKPHPGQQAFLDATARIKVLACGRRWGKTEACAEAILRVLRGADPAQILIVGPTIDQARILFDRVADRVRIAFSNAVRPLLRPFPRMDVEGHEVVARSGSSPHFLRGHEATHIFVDEAAYVHDKLIPDTLFPMQATNEGEMTLISTPNGFNFFHRIYEDAKAGGHMWCRSAPSSENPLVSQFFLESQRALVSTRTYATEYEAQFLEGKGAVFTPQAIEACLGDVTPDLKTDSYAIGIDFGRKNDFTAMVVAWGTFKDARVVDIRRLTGDATVQAEILVEEIRKYPNAALTADATGMGDIVIDLLERKLPRRKVDRRYFSRKNRGEIPSVIYSHMERKALKFAGDPQLLRELRAYTWVEGRAEGKGEHDDVVVALGLALGRLPSSYQMSRIGIMQAVDSARIADRIMRDHLR